MTKPLNRLQPTAYSLQPTTIVFDCGSTSTRVIAVSARGDFLAQASAPSAPTMKKIAGGEAPVWDIDALWRKLATLSRKVVAEINPESICAATVTTFGADGTLVDAGGRITHPVLSWQFQGTAEQARLIARRIDPKRTFRLTGYQIINFNTILKLMWLRKYAPEALAASHAFLMMPGLVSLRLSGEMSIDPTIASTTMAWDLAKDTWCDEILAAAKIDPAIFPRVVESGGVIGRITRKASRSTGIPAGVPVIAAGHDTQFAPIGAGARRNEIVLSSGTWEIAMIRSDRFRATAASFKNGLIAERDSRKGLLNPQLLMMGSGVLEWIRKHFFAHLADDPRAYDKMIRAAADVPPGSGGVMLLPAFIKGTGPTASKGTLGTLLGLTLATSPAQIYRAALEGLSFQLRHAVEILAVATGAETRRIRVVGGGAKNKLWNQLRADVTGLPVIAAKQTEATVLGAAITAFAGTGAIPSVQHGQKTMLRGQTTYRPSKSRKHYDHLYQAYAQLPGNLSRVYGMLAGGR